MLIRKINEIRSALEMGLYNRAFAMALTLPDICGKVEFPDLSVKLRYTKWFKTYAEPLFTVKTKRVPDNENVQYTWLSAKECYALRCAFLHAGNYETKDVDLLEIEIHAHSKNSDFSTHTYKSTSKAKWDVVLLCENLCNATETYYQNSPDKNAFDLNEVKIVEW